MAGSPPEPGLAQAEEAHDVAGVGVEVLALRRLVDAHVGVVGVVAEVAHVAEDVALGVLRERAAEVRADAPVDGRGLGDRVASDGHAAEQGEAAAVEQLPVDAVEDGAQAGQGEVLAR